MAEKEWYTLQELVEMFKLPYPRIRAAVFALRNAGTIKWRDNPTDARVLEIHKDSISSVKAAAGG